MIKDDKSRFILLLPSLVSISHELQMFVLFGYIILLVTLLSMMIC